jgi:trk system potassium uptake protein TrkA
MNFVIIGLGNFGASLGKKLTALGHDVIGVDKEMSKVEFFKDTIKNTVSMDITDIHALKTLPLKDADMVVVCIGDDFGSSIMTTALLKKLGVTNLYSRESSLIHKTVLNSIGVANTINPEYETASVFAEKLIMKGIWSIYNISDEIKIAEVSIPDEYIGKTIIDIDFRGDHNIKLLALKQLDRKLSTPTLEKWNALEKKDLEAEAVVLEKDMRFIVKGRKKDIMDFISL